MTQYDDPFSAPAKVASEFPTVASFRGRLVLIEPTGYEYDVPSKTDPSKKSDRITATITVVDNSGDVELYSNGSATGKRLRGPVYRGVFISQDRVVKQLLVNEERGRTAKMVLGRLETYKPGEPPRKGNPWGLELPTEADKQMARDFLANRTVAAAAPVQQTPAPAAAPAGSPFGDGSPSGNPFGDGTPGAPF